LTGFGRILEDLNGAGVRYVLIGGIALIRHGVVRATRDIDAAFDPDPANVERIRGLIGRWGATRPDGSPVPDNGIAGDRTIHLATPHGDLDLLSEKAAAVAFAELLERSEVRRVDGVEAPICSLVDLVALKRLAGRERDLVDLADLEAAHGHLPDSPTRAPADAGADDWLTLDQVAEILDAPQSFVAALVARDAIPFERPEEGFGRFKSSELRFRRQAIEDWLRSQ
jgi:hypothetical protein